MSEMIVGLTVVAIGTSAPELIVGMMSSIFGNNEIVLGNVIGSNLFNLLFILGLTGFIGDIKIKSMTIRNEIPLSLIAVVLILFFGNDYLNLNILGEGLSRTDGMILLFFFLLFFLYTIIISKRDEVKKEVTIEKNKQKITEPPLSNLRMIIYIILGLLGLYLGGNFVVDNASYLASNIGISEKIIGVTIIAIGTSLPELVTAIISIKKKKSDLVVGNVIGSNILNIFLIVGISIIINPINYITSFNIDLRYLIGGTIILLLAMITGRKCKLERWEASILLFLYVMYVVLLII